MEEPTAYYRYIVTTVKVKGSGLEAIQVRCPLSAYLSKKTEIDVCKKFYTHNPF